MKGVVCCFVMLLVAGSFSSAWAKKAEADVSAISLDVLRIDACARGKGCVVASGSMQLNLLDLADGKVDFASKVLLPARTKELRLVLGDNNTITVEDESFPLDVPSGKTSGLKLKGQKVFGKAGGFLSGLTLSLDLKKQLIVQAKKVKAKGHGKGKKNSGVEEVLYSFKLKPVVAVKTAEVKPLPENMAAVVALPDEDATLTLGDDFSMLIPAGAVSEPTIITTKETKKFVGVKDETTGEIIEKQGLASTYDLHPDGMQFPVPLYVAIRYHTDMLRESIPETSLTVLHDIENLKTDIDTDNKIATADIYHFSRVTVTYLDFSQCREKNEYNNYPETEEVEPGIVHGKCLISFMEDNTIRRIPYRLLAIDRVALKDKYELRILAKESSSSKSGTFKTSTVKDLADANNAVVAINGTLFGGSPCECTYLPDSLCSPPCYKKETEGVYPTGTTVMDGYLKRRQTTGYNEVFMAFGDDNSTGIPIKRITKNFFYGSRNEEFYSLFEKEFSISYESSIPQFAPENIYRSLDKTSNVGDASSAMRWMLSSRTTLIKTDESGTHCSYEYPDLHHSLPDSGDELTAIGYNSDAIFFLVSEQLGLTSNEFQYYTDVCSVLDVYGTKEAVMLDGGGSSQLVIKGKLINAAQDSVYTPRHVVNAIGLVPIDQEPEPTSCPNDNEYYYGQSSLGQNENTLYDCQNGDYQVSQECTYGCEVIAGKNDRCKCPYGNGFYCGDSQLGQDENALYSCQDGVFSMDKQCAYGCQENDNHVNDQCKGSSLLPVVDSVAPDKATLNELTTFTVTGQNLPSTLAFWIGECENVTSLGGTSTSMKFSCTPSWTTGEKDGVVKDEPGGTVLKEFTVNVSEGGSTLPESFTCTSGSQTQTWQGREWQRCDDGNTYTWQEAKDYCDNLVLGGYSDWRLPTNDELRSIVYCSNGTETPLAVYPDDPSVPYSCNSHNSAPYDRPTISSEFECKSEPYWSSTPYSKDTSYTLTVDFDYGYSSRENPITNHLYVRCVR